MSALLPLVALLLVQAPAPGPRPLSFQATLDAIKITAQPGQVVTRQFRLTLNRDQAPTHFRARVEDWWRSEDSQQSFYDAPGTLSQSCARWVSINPVESTVKPGETLAIRISVALPIELRAGGYWCALTVDQIPDPLEAAADEVGVRFVASVSTGIFVYVEPIQRQAAIVDIDVHADQALVKVRNEGNTPVSVEGRLEFFAAEKSAAAATANLTRVTLLTEPSRNGVLTAPLPSPEALPSGRYRVRAILDIGVDHYLGAEREVDLVRPAPRDR